MELFSAVFWLTLLKIVFIDLMLFTEHPTLRILFIVLVVAGVVFAGYRKRSRSNRHGGEQHRSYS